MRFKKDKRGIAPLFVVAAILVVIGLVFGGMYYLAATESESHYPEGKIAALAKGYITFEFEILMTENDDGSRIYSLVDGEASVIGFEGKPSVDVFGIGLPDILTGYSVDMREVTLLVEYPDHSRASDTETVLFGEGSREVTFGPFLIFDLDERHGFVVSVETMENESMTGLWEDEFVLSSDFVGRFD